MAAQRQHSLIWLQGLLCDALATPTALLLGVLLAPALVAMLFDHEPGRPRAGAIDPLRVLWTTSHSVATATALLGDLRVVGTAWIAAASGWLLAEIMPVAVRATLEAVSIARMARLRAERARLIAAWGLDERSPDQ